jgi:hypothetical protein
VYVEAYRRSDGTSLGSGGPNSLNLSVASADIIYVKVQANNPGTYRIKYSPPTPLIATTWEEGEFTTYGQTVWYSFAAAASVSYTLEWEDYNSSSSGYTGQV